MSVNKGHEIPKSRIERVGDKNIDSSGIYTSQFERFKEGLIVNLKKINLGEINSAKKEINEKSQEATDEFQDYISDLGDVLDLLKSAFRIKDLNGGRALDDFLNKKAQSTIVVRKAITVSSKQAELSGIPQNVSSAAHSLCISIERLAMGEYPEVENKIIEQNEERDAKKIKEKREKLMRINVS